MVNAIKIDNLLKHFGSIQAVRGITLNIEQGVFFGILGPNGAGKSTTLNMITGLCTPSGGSVSVFGHDVQTQYIEARKHIGLSQQEFNFDRFFNIQTLLEFQGGYFGLSNSLAKERAKVLLDQMNLYGKRKETIKSLSGGMKRRLQLAKAMMHDPKILILDEPTAGLDVELRIQFWNDLKKFNKEGKTIILTSHYLEEVEQLCQRIAFISQGLVVKEGKKEDILGNKKLQDVFLETIRASNE